MGVWGKGRGVTFFALPRAGVLMMCPLLCRLCCRYPQSSVTEVGAMELEKVLLSSRDGDEGDDAEWEARAAVAVAAGLAGHQQDAAAAGKAKQSGEGNAAEAAEGSGDSSG